MLKIIFKVYTKRGEDLSGEIYWYRNCPTEIKDLFPSLLDFDADESKWYRMEEVKGLTVSKLYVGGSLTKQNLLNKHSNNKHPFFI